MGSSLEKPTDKQVAAILKKHKKYHDGKVDGVIAEFQGLNLSDWDFDGVDLREAKFSNCALKRASFNTANLCDAVFECCDLGNAEFYGANTSDTQFYGSDLCNVEFVGANLHSNTPIHLDLERGYILYALRAKHVMFVAGCRCFRYDAAVSHWGAWRPQAAYVRAIRKYRKNNPHLSY
jgi:uncharacterized protein YjbI with pentapeptide repeats